MPRKRLIVCCDGTWNDPGDRTSIWRIKNGIATSAEAAGASGASVEQWVFYDSGVGTHWYDRLGGGTLGLGLSRNVRDAYEFLVKSYQPGDEIFAFGFSRGAYTARSLCGLINCVGLLHWRDVSMIAQAYRYYRTPPRERPHSPLHLLMEDLVHHRVTIRFLGVFDTVGALGVPFPLLKRLTDRHVQFHDTAISAVDKATGELRSIVESACQALAVDERRGPYAPALWTVPEGVDPKAECHVARPDGTRVAQEVEQVWFPGAHSDVGGGYPEKGLGDLPLAWMVARAAARGLAFQKRFLDERLRPDPLAPAHESMTRAWRLVGRLPGAAAAVRPIGPRQRAEAAAASQVRRGGDGRALAAAGREMLHGSVLRRAQEERVPCIPVGEQRYAPPNAVADGRPRPDLADLPVLEPPG
jgi:uncharacterized protein (DUF2235 family)